MLIVFFLLMTIKFRAYGQNDIQSVSIGGDIILGGLFPVHEKGEVKLLGLHLKINRKEMF